jgi:hypothetical protein
MNALKNILAAAAFFVFAIACVLFTAVAVPVYLFTVGITNLFRS